MGMGHVFVEKLKPSSFSNDNCWNFKGARLRKFRDCLRMGLRLWNFATTTTTSVKWSLDKFQKGQQHGPVREEEAGDDCWPAGKEHLHDKKFY